jgi:hypothetical protein
MLALLGGGIGTQLLTGRLRVFNAYPVCLEAIPVLPANLHAEAARTRYGATTFEKEFSRKDDGKGHLGEEWLSSARMPSTGKEKPDQMRMGCELVAPGTKLATEIHAMNTSRVELGCLALALEDFGRSPCIGGQANKGHGLVDLRYDLTGDAEDAGFVTVDADGARLTPFAAALRDEYLAHLADGADAARAVLRCAA